MNLIKIIRKYLIISMFVVMLIGGISHFFIFRLFIHYSADQILNEQRVGIENYIAEHDTLSLATTLVIIPPRIEKREISNSDHYPHQFFRDTVMYNEEMETNTPYRQIYFPVSYRNKHYLININQPIIISNDLFYAIISSLLVLILLFVLFTYIISYLLKKNIWKPLDKNLQLLLDYNLEANTSLFLKKSGIKEFDDINSVIMSMVDKIQKDFENSKIFSEDASHEMQTPLAIIKSKVDLLIQSESIGREQGQLQAVQAISKAVSRLSKLNKSLLLISKIKNNEYDTYEDVSIDSLVISYLTDLEELIQAKDLKMTANILPCILNMNPILSEILISNLFSNAIKHNVEGGYIKVELDASHLIISNSCLLDEIKGNLFDRRIKGTRVIESHGIGLNVVKSICDKNNFSAQYFYDKESFNLKIIFTE